MSHPRLLAETPALGHPQDHGGPGWGVIYTTMLLSPHYSVYLGTRTAESGDFLNVTSCKCCLTFSGKARSLWWVLGWQQQV
jgi:hypothetical protein